jgi:hypothetical protein
MLKLKKLDSLILLLMFALLPIDMINGVMLRNEIILPITLGQLFKLVIIAVLFFRFFRFNFKLLVTSCLIFLLMLIPSFYQIFIQLDASFLFNDIVKVSKYLTPLFSFLFFKDLICRQDPIELKKLFNFIWFSYIVLVVNILIKYIGLGYPMYKAGDIGSKGFFYAGNETSALFIILTSILAYNIFRKFDKWKFYTFMIFSLFVGLSISSKTGVLGILLLLILIPLERPTFGFDTHKLKKLVFTLLVSVPLMSFVTWFALKQTSVYNRLYFYWEKLDFWTFLFSHRNFFFVDAYKVYQEQYSKVEKFIGVGQVKYELLNSSKIIEIDLADLFFTYGYIGLFLFGLFIVFLGMESWKLSKIKEYNYTKFIFLMLVILLGISSIAGHVFNSGMSAVFIGLLFSLMYLKDYDVINEK